MCFLTEVGNSHQPKASLGFCGVGANTSHKPSHVPLRHFSLILAVDLTVFNSDSSMCLPLLQEVEMQMLYLNQQLPAGQGASCE